MSNLPNKAQLKLILLRDSMGYRRGEGMGCLWGGESERKLGVSRSLFSEGIENEVWGGSWVDLRERSSMQHREHRFSINRGKYPLSLTVHFLATTLK